MSEARAPRVLFLTHTPPLPLVSGERIRNFNLLRELARRGWEVSLFALDPDGRATEDDRRVLAELCDSLWVEPLRVPRRTRAARALSSLLLFRPYYERFFYDSEAHRVLLDALRTEGPYDAIAIEALYMSIYVPEMERAHALLDAHNVELRRVESMARALGVRPRGIAARMQQRPLRAYERRVAESVAAVTAVSAEDAAYFERIVPGRVTVVPNGVDCEGIRPRVELPSTPSVLFVGSMDYSANVDAVAHLAGEILPLLERGDATVTLIGSNPRREVFGHAKRSPVPIEILGYVPDTTPYFAGRRVFVVPLRFGGGTRLKILEALARGIPVVTTSLGCEGLELEHGRDLVVADEPAEFARWLDRLLGDDELCNRLAEHGRATVERLYDWRRIGDRFDAAVRGVIRFQEYDPAVSGGRR